MLRLYGWLESRNICIEMMQRIKEIDGVARVLNGRTPTGAGKIPTKKD